MYFRKTLWTYQVTKSGESTIKIYINTGTEKNYVSTRLRVHPQHWDEKNGLVKRSHPSYKHINSKVSRLQNELEQHLLDGGSLKNFGKVPKSKMNLISFTELFISEIDSGRQPLTPNTRKG